MKKRHAKAGGKNEGLARLHAESRRFQDELRCIQSSVRCHHHHSHVDSSEESSENSAWDSPQTLKELVAAMPCSPKCIPLTNASVQTSPQGECTSLGPLHLGPTRVSDEHYACDHSFCASCHAITYKQGVLDEHHHAPSCKQCVSNEHYACNPSPGAPHQAVTSKESVLDEYYVCSPSSARVLERHHGFASCSHTSAAPVCATRHDPFPQEISTSIISHHDLAKKDVVRITATTVFTANGGHLVLTAPRSFPFEDKQSRQGSMLPNDVVQAGEVQEQEPHEAHTGNVANGRNHVLSQEQKKGWKSTTTVSFGNGSAHVCTESLLDHVEENKDPSSGAALELPSSKAFEMRHQVDTPTHQDVPESHRQKGLGECRNAEEASTKPRDVDESDTMESKELVRAPRTRFFEKFTKLKEAIKTGKDNILAKRMASRIKFILQSVDSKGQASHGLSQLRSSHFGSTSKKGQWERGVPQGILSETQKDHVSDEEDSHLQLTESQGFLDPESYLENVVLALSSQKDQAYEEYLEPKIVSRSKNKLLSFNRTENPIIKSGHADKASQIKAAAENVLLDKSSIEGKNTTVHKRDFGADTNDEILAKTNEEQDNLNDSSIQNFQQKVGKPFKEMENQTNKAESTQRLSSLEGTVADEYQQTRGPDIGDRIATNDHDHSGSQSISHRKSAERLEKDPQPGHKLDRIESVEDVCISPHTFKPLVLETSTSISNAAYNEDLKQHPTAFAKGEPSRAIKPLVSDTDYTGGLVITHKSILDFPVEAAVQAANELARNLIQGATYRTTRGNAQQLASAQQDRTRHATKAVQALIGEGFDYNSMYQDLKTLQGERRKLEMRTKTAVYLQTDLKDAQHTVKQTSFGGDHLQRRKAEISYPSSGAKRQRTTRSPNRDDRNKKPNPNIWRRNFLEKKDDMPTLLSPLDISMYDHPLNKDLQKNRFDASKERTHQAVHNHIQRQRQFKAPAFSLQGSFYVDVNKKNAAPPVWVERLTQGKRSHNLRLSLREPMGGLVTKNLVRRKSVRPPGSIFKASNPIHWQAKPIISAKDSSLLKQKPTKLERQESSKSKIFNNSTYEIGSTSKSAQNVGIDGSSEELFKTKSRSVFDDEVVAIVDRQKRDADEKLNGFAFNGAQDRMSLAEDVPTIGEISAVSVPKDVNGGVVEDSARVLFEQHPEGLDKEEEMPLISEINGRKTISRGLWDIGLLEKTGTEDYQKQLENEVTKDDLLAMTLQSILNNQSTSNNDVRICDDEAKGASFSGINQSLESSSQMIEEERKQDCKSVQTMEHNPCISSHLAVPPFPVFPAFLMSNGSMCTPPSYCVPCPNANHSWMTFEQGHSCSACDLPSRKQGSSTKILERNRKNTQKGVKWSKRVYARNQESSSSTTTPSSPASIHEIEDMCETGWNQTNDLPASLPPPQDRRLEDPPNNLETKTGLVEHSMKLAATPSLENKEAGELIVMTREAEVMTREAQVCDLLSEESIENKNAENKTHKGEQKEAQTELNLISQVEWQPEVLELAMASEGPRNTDFRSSMAADEQIETKKRLSLIPYNDHIYPSTQNGERRTLANIAIPSWAVVAKPSTLSFMRMPVVPSWYEIKRPMMISSSSDTEEVMTSDTNSSSSIGELQQKALTILRESALAPFCKTKGQGKSTYAGYTSEGEIVAARSRKHENHHDMTTRAQNDNDYIELGEVLSRKPSLNLNQVHHQSSSEGELSLGYLDPREL